MLQWTLSCTGKSLHRWQMIQKLRWVADFDARWRFSLIFPKGQKFNWEIASVVKVDWWFNSLALWVCESVQVSAGCSAGVWSPFSMFPCLSTLGTGVTADNWGRSDVGIPLFTIPEMHQTSHPIPILNSGLPVKLLNSNVPHSWVLNWIKYSIISLDHSAVGSISDWKCSTYGTQARGDLLPSTKSMITQPWGIMQ